MAYSTTEKSNGDADWHVDNLEIFRSQTVTTAFSDTLGRNKSKKKSVQYTSFFCGQ